jgi:hypothetical protein
MSEFRQRLIEIEPLSTKRNEDLQKEIQAMFEPKMSAWEKFYWSFGVLGCAMNAVGCIAFAVFAPAELAMKAVWGALGVGNAVAAVFVLRRMRKGSMNLQQQFAAGKAAVGVAMFIAVLILINAINNPSLQNLAWGLCGVIGLVLAAAIAIHNRVLSAELNSREQLLQLQYRLAELAEKLSPPR